VAARVKIGIVPPPSAVAPDGGWRFCAALSAFVRLVVLSGKAASEARQENAEADVDAGPFAWHALRALDCFVALCLAMTSVQ
jgi:hypothetical protein